VDLDGVRTKKRNVLVHYGCIEASFPYKNRKVKEEKRMPAAALSIVLF
jgi:hypothetical protein